MDVREKIKRLMESQGLTIYKLSQQSDLSQACISNWYTKKKYEPSLSALEKVCIGLGVSMSELFCDGDEEMMPVNAETRELLNRWQGLTPEQREAIMALLKSI